MNNAPNKQEIFSLEKKYWDAMRNNDVEAAVSLTKFPCVVTSPKGAKRITEAQYRQMMQANKPDQFKGIEIADPHVDVLNENVRRINLGT